MSEVDIIARYRILCLLETGAKPGRAGSVGACAGRRALNLSSLRLLLKKGIPIIFAVDRWGPRTIILCGVLVTGAGMVLMSFITNLWMFYGAFLVIFLGASGASHGIPWPTAIVNWFQRLRGRALGLACMGPVVSGPFIATMAMLESAVGWRAAVRLLGLGLCVIGVPLALMVRSEPRRYGYLPDGDPPENQKSERAVSDRAIAGEIAGGLSVSQAIRTRGFWLLFLVLGLQFIGLSGLSVHLIPRWKTSVTARRRPPAFWDWCSC